jgi:hypothetical protein
VGIEACATSHHWSRELKALGHAVRLMPPAYVKPYVKRMLARVTASQMASASAASFFCRRTDPGDLIEPLARLIGAVPGHDPPVKLQDLGFQHPQLGAEASPLAHRVAGPAADQGRRDRPGEQDRQNGVGHDGQGRALQGTRRAGGVKRGHTGNPA